MISVSQFARKRKKKGPKLSVARGRLTRPRGPCTPMRTLGRAVEGEVARALRSSQLFSCVDERCASQCSNRPTAAELRGDAALSIRRCSRQQHDEDDQTLRRGRQRTLLLAHKLTTSRRCFSTLFTCITPTAALSAIDQPAATPAVASPRTALTAMSTVRQRDIKVSSTVKRNR